MLYFFKVFYHYEIMGWTSSFLKKKHRYIAGKALETRFDCSIYTKYLHNINASEQNIYWDLNIIDYQNIIWASSWDNLFLSYANNKGADQPAHPRSLISTFVVHCLDSIIPLVSVSEISSLYLASVAAQAGSSLPWLQTPKTGFLVMRLIS